MNPSQAALAHYLNEENPAWLQMDYDYLQELEYIRVVETVYPLLEEDLSSGVAARLIYQELKAAYGYATVTCVERAVALWIEWGDNNP